MTQLPPASDPPPSNPSPPAQQAPDTDPTDTSSAQPAVKRVIDENTDLSTLTDQEIRELNEAAEKGAKEVQVERPLISFPTPISNISSEYTGQTSAAVNVRKKLQGLEEEGWDLVWRARGDGDCFYRSFILAYLLRILHSESPQLASNLAFSNIQSAIPLLSEPESNFDWSMLEDFFQPLFNELKKFERDDGALTEHEIVMSLQDPENSTAMVVALRYLTSAYIRKNHEAFTPFLLNPETFLPQSVPDFCSAWIEPIGKEADQVMIMALAKCLRQGIKVCYLDGSAGEGEGGMRANFVDFEIGDEGEGVGEDPLMLLYRPGHYDVLAKIPVGKM